MREVLSVVLDNLSLVLLAIFPTLMLYVNVDDAEGIEVSSGIVLFVNMLGSSSVVQLILAMIYFIFNLVFFVRTRIKLGI